MAWTDAARQAAAAVRQARAKARGTTLKSIRKSDAKLYASPEYRTSLARDIKALRASGTMRTNSGGTVAFKPQYANMYAFALQAARQVRPSGRRGKK